jgi:hypothetical protein
VGIRVTLMMALAGTMTLAGCPPTDDGSSSSFSGAELAAADANQIADAGVDGNERDRRILAWLNSDTDQDGLPNRFELEYGLDLEDPTDGPDIDGDGVPNFEDNDVDGDGLINETDPDIDGDEVPNGDDDDVDGDAVPDELDFDVDADGIRNEWDLDFDSDGIEDKEGIAADEQAAGELMRRAQEMMAGGGDEDDDDEESSADRFEAVVEYLVERVAAGDKDSPKYQQYMDKLLNQLNRGGKRPIEPASYEAKAITEKLAERFGSSRVSKTDLRAKLNEMVAARALDLDATSAIDALFKQTTAVKNPKEPEGADELWKRLDTVLEFTETYKEADLKTCSDAVMTLGEMGGHGTLDEKIDAIRRLTEVVETPDLASLVKGLDDLTNAMDETYPYWDWGAMVDELLTTEGIEEGITADVIENVVDDDDEGGGDGGQGDGDGGGDAGG